MAALAGHHILWAPAHPKSQHTTHPTPAVHCPMGWQGTRWPRWQQRWPCDSCPSPAGPAASCSCHITILPGACPNNRRRCGGSSRMVVALPAEPVTRDPPQPHRCPVLSHEPGTDPQWSLLGSPSPSGMLMAPARGASLSLCPDHTALPWSSTTGSPVSLRPAPEGHRGLGDVLLPWWAPAASSAPRHCPAPRRVGTGHPGSQGVPPWAPGSREGAPEPSSEAWDAKPNLGGAGGGVPPLPAGFHGEHTLYRQRHHFPWIVGQQKRK